MSFYREIVFGLRFEPYIAVHRPQHHGRPTATTPWSWDDTVASWSWDAASGAPVVVDVYAGIAVVWNDAAYGAEINLYGLKGLAREPMLIPEVDFAALATGVGAEGVVVRELADLERLAEWAATPASARRFLVLDCRISGDVIAPYQQEIIRVNS